MSGFVTATAHRDLDQGRRGAATVMIAVTVALLICSGLLVYGAGRGADLTDEIFYLIWARDADAYALNYQPFGYLLHPLFDLARGDLRTYRLMGFAIAAAAGAFLGSSLAMTSRTRVPLSVYGAVAALTIFFPWIITPSYNSAANVGAMLTIAGIVTVSKDRPRHLAVATVAAGAIAAGLCVAAFSKPPLFAIAVAAIVAMPFAARRRGMTLLCIAAVILAGALIALLLPPAAMVDLARRMIASQHILALPNTPLSLPIKIARDWVLVPPALTGAAVAVAAGVGLMIRRSRWSTGPAYVGVALSLFYVASIVPDAIDGGIPDFIGLALVIAATGYAVLVGRRHDVDAIALALLVGAPVAVALGTFNNQWAQLNFSMAFPFLALFALACVDRLRWRRIAAYASSIVGPASVMLLAACYPYSLPALIFEQQVPIEHPLTHGPILVDPETAAFVRSARGLANGALVVDLSGTGPGVAAALGARAPILPWLNPATPTWPDVVWARLTARKRASAWIVGPVWPQFGGSAPARWFVAHRARYCGRALPPMTFWGEERRLEIWRPCKGTVAATVSIAR